MSFAIINQEHIIDVIESNDLLPYVLAMRPTAKHVSLTKETLQESLVDLEGEYLLENENKTKIVLVEKRKVVDLGYIYNSVRFEIIEKDNWCMSAYMNDLKCTTYGSLDKNIISSLLAGIKQNQNWSLLQYIGEYLPELCLESVKQDCWALKYVKKQTNELCLEAVKQDGIALQFVKEQTSEICLEAIKQDGLALQYVKEQTPELCLEAVKQCGLALYCVKEQTPKICLEAVKQNENAKIYIKEHTSAPN